MLILIILVFIQNDFQSSNLLAISIKVLGYGLKL